MNRSPRRCVGVCWALLAGAALLALSGCRGNEMPVYSARFEVFGARASLHLLGVTAEFATECARDLERDLRWLDYTLNTRTPGPMARVNELLATGEPFAAPPALLPLLRQSQQLAQRSDHLFNPALGMLTELWDLYEAPERCPAPPASTAIARVVAAAPTVDDITIDDISLQSDNPAVRLDWRGIATGYALDIAVAYLRARGVRHAMLQIGTDTRALGTRAGRPWRIAVPNVSGASALGMLNVSGDGSVFTRSRHAHSCQRNGRLYHPLLDPRTGMPALAVQAVTVLYRGDAAVADAAATALFVAGPERWVEIAQRLGVDSALLIDAEGVVQLSPAMAARLQLLDANTRTVVVPWARAAAR